MKLHKDVLTISYKHRFEIRKVFREVLGIHDIDHFSLDLVNPQGEMVFLSANPSHGYEICARGYGIFYGATSPEYYENYEFYWWKDVKHRAFSHEINHIHDKHGFRHGFMLVRQWNDFYLIYSFATRSEDPHFPSLIINKLNELFGLGDFIYNEMRDTYTEYTNDFTPPHIEKFYPFQGGMPPARYSNDYEKSAGGILIKENTIVSPVVRGVPKLSLVKSVQ